MSHGLIDLAVYMDILFRFWCRRVASLPCGAPSDPCGRFTVNATT